MPRARDLGDFLPHWFKAPDEAPSPPYANLKTAAIALVRATEAERRNVIDAYSWAYCEAPPGNVHRSGGDLPRASGMYLLLRVLFVVPTHHPIRDVVVFGPWHHPPRGQGVTAWDLSYPVHVDRGGRLLRIDSCCSSMPFNAWSSYSARAEYDYFSARFSRRTPAELEALDIE